MIRNQTSLYVYYLSLGWWILRLSLIVFILIPGSVPLMIGYLASLIYRYLDPELTMIYKLEQVYHTTLGQLSEPGQILFITVAVISVLVPYFIIVRKRHPRQTWVQIGKHQINRQLDRFQKPTKPGNKETANDPAD